MRAEALKSMLDNYDIVLDLWDESLEIVKNIDMKARIQGVKSLMRYLYGVWLGHLILKHSDDLS